MTLQGLKSLAIVALAPNEWIGPWTGRQQFLSRLARRGWRIVYSTGPLALWQRGTPQWKLSPYLGDFIEMDGVRVDRPARLMPVWRRSTSVSAAAMKFHGLRLRREALSAGSDKLVALVFHPSFEPCLASLDPDYVLYHAFDRFAATPGWNSLLASHEQRLVERADRIFSASRAIGIALPSPGNLRFVELPNGADYGAFAVGDDIACPPDLSRIPRPRVSYCGRITPKVDLNLVAEVAAARPDWQWIFVGPVVIPETSTDGMEQQAREGLQRCRRLPNVHFLGPRHHTELPAYMAHADVNVMVYRLEGGWWADGYPLKLHEYLAVGRPVVSTPISAVTPFAGVIALAETPSAWIDAIAGAVNESPLALLEERRRVARENSWDVRCDVLEGCLLELASRQAAVRV